MPTILSLRLRITSKGVIPVPEDEPQHVAHGERPSIAVPANASATRSYLRKRQAAKNSCDDHNVKKQKIEEAGLDKASLNAPCTTGGPKTLEENKLESCSAKSAQPGLRRPNRCLLLGRTAETENCGQNAVFEANHSQSIPSSCTRGNGPSVKSLRDKSSERSLPRHDQYGRYRCDGVVEVTLGLPAHPRPGSGSDGHKVVRKRKKDANIKTVAPTAASGEDCATFAVEMSPKKVLRAAMLKKHYGDTNKRAIHIEEEKSRNHIVTYGERASTNVSAPPSYPRKRQAAKMSHDGRNEKKQKMDSCLKIEEVGLHKAALNAPRTTYGPISFKEKKESNRCLGKTIKAVKPGSRRPTRSSLSKRTTLKESCVQNPPSAVNRRQSVQRSCTHANDSSVPTLSDKSSKRSLSGQDRSGYSRHDSEVKYAPALPANGHGVVLKEDKDANIPAATTTGAHLEDCVTFTVQMSPKKALRAALLKRRFADIIFKSTHQGNLNNVQEEKEILERERRKENAKIKAEIQAASRRLQTDSKPKHEKERVAARMALEKLKETVEVVDNFAVLKEFMALSPPSKDEYGSGNPLQRLGLFLKEDYLEDEECSQDNTPGDMH